MSLPELIAIVAVMTAIGVFVDFLLYNPGRARVAAAPEHWWVRFGDVSRNNFGRKEAEFAVSVLDRWFGRRFFSVRRFVICVGILLFWWAWGALQVFPHFRSAPFRLNIFNQIAIVISYFSLALSISFSRWVAIGARSLMTGSAFQNYCLFTGVLVVTYVSMVIWLAMTRTISSLVPVWLEISIFYSTWIDAPRYIFGALYSLREAAVRMVFLDVHWNVINAMQELLVRYKSDWAVLDIFLRRNDIIGWANFTMSGMSAYTGHLARLALALIFVGSYILRPLAMRPISLIWRRIVESDKPIFTMIFGGAAAAVTAINEIANNRFAIGDIAAHWWSAINGIARHWFF
jgi:hypothetical protein